MKRLLPGAGLALLIGGGLWFALTGLEPETSTATVASALERMTASSQTAANVVSGQVISAADLPPAGTRSLFDHHLAQLGALPYPFSALLDSFKTLDRWEAGSVSLLIPDGRSLRKSQASFVQPRVLVAAQVDAHYSDFVIKPIYSGRLFLGFVEAANEIEVISYNEAAGRFEYQLVKDYCAGCVPRIVYATRAVCLTCHQSGTPIFSARPWEETNAHRAIAEQIASARSIAWLEAGTTLYHGASLSTQLLIPETFDELTVSGATLPTIQKIWLDGCGASGIDCRRQILAEALSLLMEPGRFNPTSTASQRVRELQQTEWPAGGIHLPNNLIPSRNPFMERPWTVKLLQVISNRLAIWRQMLSADKQSEGELATKLAAFERAPRLPPELDPLIPRPPREVLSADSLFGVQGLARMFTPNDRRRLSAWSKDHPQRVYELVLSGGLDELLGPAPANRVLILQALARALGHPAPDYCCHDTGSFSPPRAENTPPLTITPGSVLEVFRKYCFACHRGNPNQKLNFMGASTEAEVLRDIRARHEIHEVLDYARFAGTSKQNMLMPPPRSLQRAQLEESRVRGAGDLEQMQNEISPLFEF